ncbi:MAG: DUF58 domain-containing protein [Clostridia bacterium]|nr:DUF58 domain-containing protein [Clostridia bacterium]
MTKRRIGYFLWLFTAVCLYFFENNPGTRIVLCLTVGFALIPGFRRAVLCRQGREEKIKKTDMETDPLSPGRLLSQEADPGTEVRPYVPGDPSGRIHWKLTARHDEIWTRMEEPERAETEKEKEKTTVEFPVGKRRMALCLTILWPAAALVCLLLVPWLRHSAGALCNRLFEESERVNAYLYPRFSHPEGEGILPAAVWLCLAFAGPAAAMIRMRSRLMALCFMIFTAAFQVYFGLSLPPLINVALFLLFALWCVGDREAIRKNARILALAVLSAVLVTVVFFPGVDAATETASEKARDLMAEIAGTDAGADDELPGSVTETRHTHILSPMEGEGGARTGKEYRRVSVGEEQISGPDRTDWAGAVLLILLAFALLILPFLPFAALNARRKKARETVALFESGDTAEAICLIFGRVIAWLDAMDCGQGNLPCRDWAEGLTRTVSPEYALRFARCAAAFEEAAYSGRAPGEEKRREALELLEETGNAMLQRADGFRRLKLRYIDCLWV